MNLIRRVIDSRKKHWNRDIMEGYSVEELKQAPEYLDKIIRIGIRSLPKEIGLEYLGYRYMTPREDFNNQFAVSTQKYTIDIAKSTIYKIVFEFNFQGERFERVLALPYVERGGLLYLSDTPYAVLPVLTEYVISSTNGTVFVRLLKDKITYIKRDVVISKDGQKYNAPVVVSKVYKFTNNVNEKVPVVLLLMVRYGLKFLSEKFNTKILVKHIDTVTEEDKKRYTVLTTLGKRPRVVHDVNYRPHHVAFLIEKDKLTPLIESYIAGIITALDLVPLFGEELLRSIHDDKKEHRFWKILLGKVIFRNNFTIDKIMTIIDEYLTIIDDYIDTIIKEKLAENNIIVDNIYDLVEFAIDNFDRLVIQAEVRSSSIDSRYVDVIYYVLYEMIEGINKTFYSIRKEFYKKKLGKKDIDKIFNQHLSTKKVYSLIKNGGVNIALMPVDYSGNNLFSKITSVLEDQNRGQGVKRSSKNVFPKSTRSIHAEDLLIGSLFYLTKKAPTPRLRINPYSKIDRKTGKFIIDDKAKQTLEELSKLLGGKILASENEEFELNDDNISDIE